MVAHMNLMNVQRPSIFVVGLRLMKFVTMKKTLIWEALC